jgi:hypothetical protein
MSGLSDRQHLLAHSYSKSLRNSPRRARNECSENIYDVWKFMALAFNRFLKFNDTLGALAVWAL